MEEGEGERYLASGHQYGNALLGVCHQEEEGGKEQIWDGADWGPQAQRGYMCLK